LAINPMRLRFAVFGLAAVLAVVMTPTETVAQSNQADASLIKDRHLGSTRERATRQPRSETDQAVVDGWPYYRTERGQTAFNDAMATLLATDTASPSPNAFRGCAELACPLVLPKLTADGWLPAGRLWTSPTDYVLVAHSPRLREGQSYRRRNARDMRVFVFHEFHNSSRNTDLYDTISAHRGAVFVPFYMSKSETDAKGRRFVVVVQVAPHDVASIHASNKGSAGPGIEVARNASDAVDPLQNQAGILVATMVKAAAPQLQIVNHNGREGFPMLQATERRLALVQGRAGVPAVTLPFVPAAAQRIATATGRIADVVARRGAGPPRWQTAGMLGTPMLIGPIRLAPRPAPPMGLGLKQ
jgi:hypothetical protein